MKPQCFTVGLGARSVRRTIALLTGMVLSTLLWAGGPASLSGPAGNQQGVSVPVNQSRVIDLPSPVARVSVANPAIADILIINPRQIYINGKQLGTTNMIFWDQDDRVQRQVGLQVTHDLQGLKEKLHRFMPGDRVRVESAQGAIVLSGEVSSPAKIDAAMSLAQSFAGTEKAGVINLLQVGGAQQVLLEVKVAEVQRSMAKDLDIDFLGLYNGGSVQIGLVNAGLSAADAVPATGVFGSVLSGNFFAEMELAIAESRGLAKILAEPNLTTLSGQQAEFLSGGQIPYQTVDDDGQVTTEFKNVGINLSFIPFVLDSGIISLKVNVSVSEQGEIVPTGVGEALSIVSRGANATVEVPSGQTIAIAGLLSETTRGEVDKLPGLGSIPVLGALFRSQGYRTGQTELIIFVTPRLARSFASDEVRLPTDDFVEPSDVEFYLMGRLEGRRPETPAAPAARRSQRLGPDKSGSEGPFGHDL
ncbi:type II and III secretion system protein family protein [Thiohalocapsa marina]|uniref:Type II and III secretion system protein family protein n=1 Tax=Thiohalocapsa marina TaxID=424902 RepID=A0A5M8FIF1_9GAMM|nr:type II and III secretion system protein family protein [Thiohalocapsa marina]KAA6184698.1 type II and III secretion system protein family protein [Thiohalocapsa marina]